LKHIERTQILVHIIDPSNSGVKDVIKRYRALRDELRLFNPKILEKREIVVINKIDIKSVRESMDEIRKEFEFRGIEPIFISSLNGEGLNLLLTAIAKCIKDKNTK